MAATITVGVVDPKELRADLESVELGLARAVGEALVRSAEPVRLQTAANTPVGPGPQSVKDNLPHIADTIEVSPRAYGAAITSAHPGSGPLEYGGTIAPKGTPFRIDAHEMARRAGEQKIDEVADAGARAIDELCARHGL